MAFMRRLFKRNRANTNAFNPNVHVRQIGDIDSYATIDDFNREYLAMREEQALWLEQKYDFTTIEGIRSIPLNAVNAPQSSNGSSTGTADMHLRSRGFQYEKDGEEDLALACLKRSNEIRQYKRIGYRKDDYYSYVRMLVRFAHISEARQEKKRIDKFFGNYVDDAHTTKWTDALRYLHGEARKKRIEEIEKMHIGWNNLIPFELEKLNKNREYKFVLTHFPDLCPKSQAAYTRAKNSNSKRYLEIVAKAEEMGLRFPEKIE